MKVEFDQLSIHQNIHKLADALGAEVIKDCSEYRIDLPRSVGKGSISGFEFDYGIGLFLYDCELKKELQIAISDGLCHPLHFNFCVQGDFRHTLSQQKIIYHLNPLTGSISANPQDCTQVFCFAPKVKLVHTNLQIYRAKYVEKVDCDVDKMHEKLAAVFSDVEAQQTFLHEMNYNIQTAECIRNMLTNEFTDMVRSAYIEAKALELLALQLKQFADDMDPDMRFVTLKKYDLDTILKAKEILVSDLQDAPTIKELAKMSGINQQKLKSGFKQIFGMTINQYLREYRLETAKFLIMEGKSSIQDVAERVGYSSQSHFARRFREKFGLLPKDALRMVSLPVNGKRKHNKTGGLAKKKKSLS